MARAKKSLEEIKERAREYRDWPETFDIEHPIFWIRMAHTASETGKLVYPYGELDRKYVGNYGLSAALTALGALSTGELMGWWGNGIDMLANEVAEIEAQEGVVPDFYYSEWPSQTDAYIRYLIEVDGLDDWNDV